MTSANLELVRSIHAGWDRGDLSSVEWADPEIEYVIADGPAPGRWSGLSGLAEGVRSWVGTWAEFGTAADEYRELDDERVLVLTRFSGRGKSSGLDLTQVRTRGAHLFHIREGKVTRLVLYMDSERALSDLGLASETSSTNS